ncbi:MAG TPA: hypothetical protein VLI66_08265 [Terrabacter sp.]|nr:hypothetical protein [Terrabacter sp.]
MAASGVDWSGALAVTLEVAVPEPSVAVGGKVSVGVPASVLV